MTCGVKKSVLSAFISTGKHRNSSKHTASASRFRKLTSATYVLMCPKATTK